MSDKPKNISRENQEKLNKRLGPIYRKVGMITFTIGMISILIGLLIDRVNDTAPFFTIAVLILSVPLVLLFNTRMLRAEIDKMAADSKNKNLKA